MVQPGVWPEPPLTAPHKYLARPARMSGFRGGLQPRRVLSSPELASTRAFKKYASASSATLTAYLSTGQYGSASCSHLQVRTLSQTLLAAA